MNIVYRGSCLDPSGYGDGARRFALGLDRVGVQMQIVNKRHVFSKTEDVLLTPDEHKRIIELMSLKMKRPFIQVDHQTPEWYDFKGDYNIGYTMTETSKIHPKWQELMDSEKSHEIWTITNWSKQVFIKSGVTKDIYVFPHGVDTTVYRPDAPKLKIKGKKAFNFLWLGQYTVRKSPDMVVSAFLQEFSDNEDVALIMKTYMADNSEEDDQLILKDIRRIESDDLELRADRPTVLVIHDLLPEPWIAMLHAAVDCFVFPSKGEALGMPILHAMASEKPVIVTNWSGPTDVINDSNAFPLQVDRMSPCLGMENIPWYQPDMQWAQPSVLHLRHLMRYVFEHREEAKERGKKARETVIKKFEWLDIAQRQKERLEAIWSENFK